MAILNQDFKSFYQKYSSTIILLLLIVIFFSFSIILTYDSGHYLSYVSIFEGSTPASSWDIVRGPVFPAIIHLSDILFGKTNAGILVCTFLFYLSFVLICHILCKEIFKNCKKAKLLHTILFAFLILNPLIFGYFHVLLTEFIAITITMLNILFAYKWIFIDFKRTKALVLYSFYFIATTIFCWHLKQPYIVIAITPPLIASIISIINNHTKKNVLYRLSTVFISFIFLALSILLWNRVLDIMQVNKNTGRDSASSLSKQLVLTYDIDSENYSFSTFLNELAHNPGHIVSKYINNYCSLSSLCKITTKDGVNYSSTNDIDLFNTYENTAIGYATYDRNENLFHMSEDMQNRASGYATKITHSVFRPIMKILSYPTNILFKTVILLCIPFTFCLIVTRIKTKYKKHESLFCLSLILLTTASFHLAFSAVALVIDRYAIEAFTPATIGIAGTIIYTRLAISSKTSLKSTPRKRRKNNA